MKQRYKKRGGALPRFARLEHKKGPADYRGAFFL